ncbi:MAG: VIT1/CCC1 transporter family protein [Formivibrio sp.]|nr:VIT1/CCC1 transporter family protein [Formivibrio sp.]
MPSLPHTERHFRSSETVRDIVIGMADGLTVPFALAAGLTGAVASGHIITTAGLAEIAAGAVAMGLGGYLAARGDAEHYGQELRRELEEVEETPDLEAAEIIELFQDYGVSADQCESVVAALRTDRDAWVRFMMRFELGLEKPDPRRALHSAVTIAGAYIVGGLIPIMPYFLFATVSQALQISIGLTLLALAVFGYIKGGFTGIPRWRSSVQTTVVGGIAAAVAFLLARLI